MTNRRSLNEELFERSNLDNPSFNKFKKDFLSDFESFKKKFWTGYEPAPHLTLIDKYLAQVAEYVMTSGKSGINRLMVFVHPRSGKSTTVSRMFPSFMIGIDPNIRTILASYNQDLPISHSRQIRNTINHPEYSLLYPHTKVAIDKSSAKEWGVMKYLGGCKTAGIGSGITGYGGDICIIDDPVKGRQEAESASYRKRAIDWYNSDFITRVENPRGVIILMLTRWHIQDLAGYLLTTEPENWTVLSIPALCLDVENDPLNRKYGEAMWSKRYDETYLSNYKKRAPYEFEALYQQSPLRKEGKIYNVDNISILTSLQIPPIKKKVRYWDLAIAKGQENDFTVGLLMGITFDREFIILDVWRKHTSYPEAKKAIVECALKDGKDVRVYIEAEKSGIAAYDELIKSRDLKEFKVHKDTPSGDKISRSATPSEIMNAGSVYMSKAEWNDDFYDELDTFPQGHDDQADCFAGAIKKLDTSSSVEVGEFPDIDAMLEEKRNLAMIEQLKRFNRQIETQIERTIQ